MIWTVFFLLLVIAIAWPRRPRSAAPAPKLTIGVDSTISHHWQPYADPDQKLIELIRSNPKYDKALWGFVAGFDHSNSDGSSRQEILARCHVPEPLRLVPEPDNPVDLYAIKVVRENGEQIGYLQKKMAKEISERLRSGERWEGILYSIGGKPPHPHKYLAAYVTVVRLKA